MPTARQRSGAAALAAAGVTGVLAFVFFLGGAALLWANGHYRDAEGYFATGSARFATAGHALTTHDLDAGRFSRARSGTIRLTARGRDEAVFVGVARTADVRAYLRDVARTEVADVSVTPFSARSTARPGTRRPAPPTHERFWAAAAHGDGAQTVRWPVERGDWSVVVMNADGSAGVDTVVSAGAKVPYLISLAWGVLALGLGFVVTTAALTLYGTRPAPRRLVAA